METHIKTKAHFNKFVEAIETKKKKVMEDKEEEQSKKVILHQSFSSKTNVSCRYFFNILLLFLVQLAVSYQSNIVYYNSNYRFLQPGIAFVNDF